MSGVKESTSGGETPPEMVRIARKGLLKVIKELRENTRTSISRSLGFRQTKHEKQAVSAPRRYSPISQTA